MREPHRQICPEFWKAERTTVSIRPVARRIGEHQRRDSCRPVPARPSSACRRNARAMRAADRRAAGEADRLDPGMLDQRLADLAAAALHDVEHAGRKADFAARVRRASRRVTGVTSLGLATTQLPAASAGAIFQVNRYSGRFHGLMQPTTPSGWRSVRLRPASPWCDSLANWRGGRGEEAQVADRARDLDVARQGQRLAAIARFGAGEFLEARFQRVGELVAASARARCRAARTRPETRGAPRRPRHRHRRRRRPGSARTPRRWPARARPASDRARACGLAVDVMRSA